MCMTQNSVKRGLAGVSAMGAETLGISEGALLDVLAVQ